MMCAFQIMADKASTMRTEINDLRSAVECLAEMDLSWIQPIETKQRKKITLKLFLIACVVCASVLFHEIPKKNTLTNFVEKNLICRDRLIQNQNENFHRYISDSIYVFLLFDLIWFRLFFFFQFHVFFS